MSLDTALATLCICGTMLGSCFLLGDYLHQQTAALTRVAVATEAMAAHTKPPVSIQVSGFSPEAQAVFNEALKPAKKGKVP